jgi:multidrug/hemolysin transport system permease protein
MKRRRYLPEIIIFNMHGKIHKIVCFLGMGICLAYVGFVGFYMSALDVVLLALDVFLIVMFGTALSSIAGHFMSSQGQISAVGTIVSAGYGFICGAYMPISSFGNGMQKAVLFLPGTYGTSLLRNHALSGVFNEMENRGIPSEAIIPMQNAVDCNLKWGGYTFTEPVMYLILGGSALLLVAVYVAMNFYKKKAK